MPEPVPTLELETPHGPARAHLHLAKNPRGALVLGHGAAGGVGAPDLLAVTRAAVADGISVVLTEQPYRIAGRRSPAPARHLDAAFTAILEQLRAADLGGLAVVTGGRSSGARVACRTAAAVGAAGVLCLAFPLFAPRRGVPLQERPSRLGELEAVTVPVLIVQGLTDPFGMPEPAPGRTVVQVAGDHSLRKDLGAVSAATGAWLATTLA